MSIAEKNNRLQKLEAEIREEISQADNVIHPFILAMMAEAAKLADELRHS